MANRIAGITVEINGDTTKLSKALEGVNKDIRSTQSQLKDVEKLLKLDPTNTELLTQKQKLLANEVASTKDKLQALKNANEQAARSASNYDAWKAAYDPIQAEIEETNTTGTESFFPTITPCTVFLRLRRYIRTFAAAKMSMP